MGEKGTQLNKCLCKAHVCGVIMVNVLNFRGDNEPKCLQPYEACILSGIIRIVLRVIVMVLLLFVFLLLCMRFTTKCCMQIKCSQSQVGPGNPRLELLLLYVTKQQHIANDFLGSFTKCLTTFYSLFNLLGKTEINQK